jgi:hypothetical protein
MDAPVHAPPAADDALYEASYQAALTRTLGFWLWACIGVLAFPMLWGAFGIVPLSGALLLFIVIPIRAWWWARRYGGLPRDHDEMRRGAAAIRVALSMWIGSPLLWVLVGWFVTRLVERYPH